MTPFEADFDRYLKARFTLIVIVTIEEERALQSVKTVCDHAGRHAVSWDAADGFSSITAGGPAVLSREPLAALEQVDKIEDGALFVLRDFHECWQVPAVKRKLRNMAQRFRSTRKNIVVLAPVGTVPEELRDLAVVLLFPAARAPDFELILEKLAQTPGVQIKLTIPGREKIVQAALGLTISQAERVFAKAIVRSGGVLDERDIPFVMDEKKQVIRQSEALEFYEPSEGLADVGGLEVLKDWLRARGQAFGREAREYGLPAPKGIALVGIPGTGKSLTAKMIGTLWQLPLLRLDVGALFGSYIGESEERARRALRVADTVAPCIVWIDELEKALAQGSGDGGTGTRVFGTILTWMQEKTSPCFVIATANDVSKLPPELLRRGRFDEIFFLDLPNLTERRAILAVHLRKRARDPAAYDLARLAAECDGYVGAEIEQAIIDAMYAGFNDGRREFTTGDISGSIRQQVPMSVSAKESIASLRRMLTEGRAQSASLPDGVAAD